MPQIWCESRAVAVATRRLALQRRPVWARWWSAPVASRAWIGNRGGAQSWFYEQQQDAAGTDRFGCLEAQPLDGLAQGFRRIHSRATADSP